MRVLALAGFRLRTALVPRVVLAPLVALVAVQLIGLSGGVGPAGLQLATAVSFALPVLAWLVRQVLDAEPDEQVLLSTLAVGGAVRQRAAGLLAAYVLAAPAACAAAWASLLRVDDDGVRSAERAAGTVLALATALAAVAVGALASRAVAGTGASAVVVLVAAPVLVAVVGLAGGLAGALVPRLAAAVRAAYDGQLVAAVPGVVAQTVLWSLLVLALGVRLSRR